MLFSKTNQISGTERTRLLDYLIFRLAHGGDVLSALKSYMEGNKSKSSKPVNLMIEDISQGESFADTALKYKLVDKFGYLILSTGISPAKSLPVVKETAVTSNFGVTALIIKEMSFKYLTAVMLAYGIASDSLRTPLVSVYSAMNSSAVAVGAKEEPLPPYLADPWFTMKYVVLLGIILAFISTGLWYLNRYKTEIIYRFVKFRFYEDWSSLLSLFIAFKAAGQSDRQAAYSLANASLEGSFNQTLFLKIGEAMQKKGQNFYEVLSEHEAEIPSEVLTFFLDASKTGRISAYVEQARDFCIDKVESIRSSTEKWAPTLIGISMLLAFGIILADLFVKLTVVTLKPIS